MSTFAPDALRGMTAVVTGSSTGIGRAIAWSLSQAGAALMVHGRSASAELELTAKQIRSAGGDVLEVPCDLSDCGALAAFVDTCWSWRGHVDVWVNNAGADVLTGALAEASFTDRLESLWRVDVRAALLLSRDVGARMCMENTEAGERSILNLGWDQAWQGMEGESGLLFGSTKGAVMAMTKSLAQSLAPQVRVNCLAPGWIRTEWGARAGDYWQRRAQQDALMNRWGDPDDVAALAVMLSSPAARFISGQIVNVNGGFRYGSRT